MRTRGFALLTVACAVFATEPNEATRRWWTHVTALSGDDLKGRDTGSEGYRTAGAYVVDQLSRAGVKPAGEQGWYQKVPLRAVRLRTDQSEIGLSGRPLRWLHAHFLHTPASVVRYAARLLELPWSASAHAKDVWTTPTWDLTEKMAEYMDDFRCEEAPDSSVSRPCAVSL